MANLVRNRKRVFPLRRAPDGSAFLKCDLCGVSVAIAIYDMHECKKLKQARKGGKQRCESFSGDDQRKALKCEDGSNNGEKSFSDQPRSAFCFFMESLQKGNFIHVDRNGFEKWKCMSDKERSPFVLEAEKVNSAYENILLKEAQIEPLMDDEADSAKVNKFDWDVDESDDIWWQSEMYRLQTGFSSSWIDDTLDRLW